MQYAYGAFQGATSVRAATWSNVEARQTRDNNVLTMNHIAALTQAQVRLLRENEHDGLFGSEATTELRGRQRTRKHPAA